MTAAERFLESMSRGGGAMQRRARQVEWMRSLRRPRPIPPRNDTVARSRNEPFPVKSRVFLNVYDADQEQRIHCQLRDNCLKKAATENWRAFSCRKCKVDLPSIQ